MGIADRMHVIDAVLRHVRSGDLASTDEGGCTTLRSIIDLALEDLVTFDQRMPVVAAFLRHNALSADIINHPDDNGFTVLHSIVIEITYLLPMNIHADANRQFANWSSGPGQIPVDKALTRSVSGQHCQYVA